MNQDNYLYNYIKQKYPNLNHSKIKELESKIGDILKNRNQSSNQILDDRNFTSFSSLSSNDSIPTSSSSYLSSNFSNADLNNLKTNNEYIPRVNQPSMQNRFHRNSFEDNYQQVYKEREDYAQQEYYNSMKKHGKNFNEDVDHKRELFLQQEKLRRQQFKLEQQEREFQYKEKQKERYQQFQQEINDVPNQKIDPLELFQLTKNFNLNQLKSSYKKLAIKYHPDRGGSPEYFKLISKAYVLLNNDYEKRQGDKQYDQLKNEYQSYTDKEQKYQSSFNLDPDKFNLDKFNQLYEQNRIAQSNDEGYGDWKTQDESEEPKQIFNEKFNLNLFNNVFKEDKKKDQYCNQVINYDDPSAYHKGTMMNYTSISDDSVGNYSSDVSASLQFTDYKQAHTQTKLINPDSVKYKQYSSVEDLEKDRERISYQMTEEDIAKYNRRKKKEEVLEQERLNKVKQQNEFNEQYFNRMNKLMIDNFSK